MRIPTRARRIACRALLFLGCVLLFALGGAGPRFEERTEELLADTERRLDERAEQVARDLELHLEDGRDAVTRRHRRERFADALAGRVGSGPSGVRFGRALGHGRDPHDAVAVAYASLTGESRAGQDLLRREAPLLG